MERRCCCQAAAPLRRPPPLPADLHKVAAGLGRLLGPQLDLQVPQCGVQEHLQSARGDCVVSGTHISRQRHGSATRQRRQQRRRQQRKFLKMDHGLHRQRRHPPCPLWAAQGCRPAGRRAEPSTVRLAAGSGGGDSGSRSSGRPGAAALALFISQRSPHLRHGGWRALAAARRQSSGALACHCCCAALGEMSLSYVLIAHRMACLQEHR